MRHKIQLDHVPEKKQLSNTDTILAIVEVANTFNAQCIPLFVSIVLFVEHNDTGKGTPLFFQMAVILGSNTVSVLIITILIFVSWKKGPRWWTDVSHFTFGSLIFIVFLVIPIANVGLTCLILVYPSFH